MLITMSFRVALNHYHFGCVFNKISRFPEKARGKTEKTTFFVIFLRFEVEKWPRRGILSLETMPKKNHDGRRIVKISTKGRYGLRILIDLATHDPAKPRLIRDIAQSQQISEKYISRLVINLRRAKLIRSVRGVNGGFHLAKLLEQITLLEVLETMEGPISVVDCVRSPEKCKRQTLCPARSIWTELNDGIRELTSKITLDDILNAYRRQNAENGICDYCI